MVTYGSKPNYQYPASRLTLIRGKWHVIVSIPAQMRHLYGNTQRDKRISTGTTDRGIAERQLHDLSKRIYDELDLKQSQYLARHNVATDTFAIDAIYGLAAAFNHKPIPDLKPSTSYDQLKAFKTSCDVYAKMIMNAANPEEAKALGEILSSPPSPLKLVEKFKELQVNSPYSTKQKGLAGRYMTSMVHTYWNDLLIAAAREQGLPEHRPERTPSH